MVKKCFTCVVVTTTVLLIFIATNLRMASTEKLQEIYEKTDYYPALESINSFSDSLSIQINKTYKNKNTVYSPYGIFSTLAMVSAGAKEKTKKEFLQALSIDLELNEFHREFKRLNRLLTYPKNIQSFEKKEKKPANELNLTNEVFIQKNSPVLPDFTNTIESNYDAGFEQVDFEKNKEAAIKKINELVAEKTNFRIKKAISSDDCDETTKLVLVNTIYFDGKWENEFKPEKNHLAPFVVNFNTIVDTTMMEQTESFKYFEDKDVQIIEIPYKKNEFSMVIFLPNQIDGLQKLENKLRNQEIVRNYLKTLKSSEKQEVLLKMPKFEFETKYNLKDILINIGIRNAFSNSANFSGINGEYDLYLSKVIHKAFIRVNEKGTKASAATSAIINTKSIHFKLPVATIFNADHPFRFIIKENKKDLILFDGKLTKP